MNIDENINKILKLEINKVFKELDYIKSEYEYKKEYISSLDNKFMEEVNEYLDNNPNVKDKYYDKENKINESRINEIKNSEEIKDVDIGIENFDDENVDVENIKNNEIKNPRLKKLYRDIVKLTHPDKIKNYKLNNFYIEATEFYNNDDIFGIYMICSELNIDYDIEDEEIKLMENEINNIKKKLNFIQSTFTWKWSKLENDKQREKLIIQFIGQRLNS